MNEPHTDETRDEAAGRRALSSVSARAFSAQVAGTLAARVLMACNSVGVGVLVARWLGAEQLGIYAPLNVTVALAVQIGSMGLASANTYFVAQDRRRLRRAARISFAFALAAGALLALALTALSASEADPFGDVPTLLFAVAAVSIPFQLTTLLGLNLFLAVGRVARLNLLDVAGQTLLLFNAVVALLLLRGGLLTLVALNTSAAVVLSLFVAWLTWRLIDEEAASQHRQSGATKSEPLFRLMMRYGLKVHAQTVASLLLFRVDLLIVKYFHGAEEAGVYSVASQVALMLMLLPGVISTLLFPRVAAEGDPRGALACRVTRHTAFVMLLVCAAAVPAVFALPRLYGASFADAVVQSLILLPGVFLVSVGGVLAQHFSGTGLPPALPLFWTAALVFNTALNFACVPRYGARGAAIASAASYALVCALIAFYFRARTGNSLRAAFVLSRRELRELLSLGRRTRFS
ncbi:MAG TPA: oligosaccharide flippase family protein [Pyrinomonadaceae bacterium]|nr:oligosaccharide flippase family protein [Pyrinomonadaceae bacterium]